jgi:hypothetical protein
LKRMVRSLYLVVLQTSTQVPVEAIGSVQLPCNPPRQFSHPLRQSRQRSLIPFGPRQRRMNVIAKGSQPALLQVPRSKERSQQRPRRGPKTARVISLGQLTI